MLSEPGSEVLGASRSLLCRPRGQQLQPSDRPDGFLRVAQEQVRDLGTGFPGIQGRHSTQIPRDRSPYRVTKTREGGPPRHSCGWLGQGQGELEDETSVPAPNNVEGQ